MSNLIAREYQGFEQIKQVDENGIEYWYARELAPVLEYSKWENFQKVIDRAMLACRNSGMSVFDQFPEVRKLIEHGKKGMRKVVDYKLSRYAGYMGLYGGETVQDIHKRKQLSPKQKILDYMNGQELIANLFRISLAEDKIRKEQIEGTVNATVTHNKVGQEVRETIKRVQGVLPEEQPTPAKSIEDVQREQLKKLKAQKTLMLDE